MKHNMGFAFGFLLTFLAIAVFAQEKALVRVFTEGAGGDTLPSPANGSGYYVFAYDLGFTQPANVPLQVNVYGKIPQGSKLYVCSVYDGTNYSHLRTMAMIPGGDSYGGRTTIVRSQPIPFRSIALLRLAEGTPSYVMPDGSISKSVFKPENGMDAVIDSVTIGRPQSITSYQMPYGRFLISNKNGLKTLSPLK